MKHKIKYRIQPSAEDLFEVTRYWRRRDASNFLKRPSIRTILHVAAAYYGLPPEEFNERQGRHQSLVRAHHISIFVSKTLSKKSNRLIGMTFNRTNSSVQYSVRKTRERSETDKALRAEIAEIKSLIGERP